MLRVQGTSSPAVNCGITIHQQGACSCIAELFSRAIKWIKELFSCGKKTITNPSPIIAQPLVVARPIVPVLPQLLIVAPPIAPVLPEQPPAPPQERLAAAPDLPESEQPEAAVLPPQRILPAHIRRAIDRIDVEQANQEIILEHRRRANFESEEDPNLGEDAYREVLENCDAVVAALRARIETLLAIPLPPDLVVALPDWNRIQVDTLIADYEELVQDLLNRMREEVRPGDQEDLNGYQALLHLFRVLRAVREREPERQRPPVEPRIVQRPLEQVLQEGIDNMYLHVVNEDLANFDRRLEMDRRDYRRQMDLEPRNEQVLAEYHRILAMSDAHLAALQIRQARLQAASLPQIEVQRIQQAGIVEVAERIGLLQNTIQHLRRRIPELQGIARKWEQHRLNRIFAEIHVYRSRQNAINLPDVEY